MLRFAANLTMMYTEYPFPERFAAAAQDGFVAVEYLFPYAHPAALLASLLERHGLQQVLINAPAGPASAVSHLCPAARRSSAQGSIAPSNTQ
jgi:hydroxypyruvate isomerase